jgi:hypothetical protein
MVKKLVLDSAFDLFFALLSHDELTVYLHFRLAFYCENQNAEDSERFFAILTVHATAAQKNIEFLIEVAIRGGSGPKSGGSMLILVGSF